MARPKISVIITVFNIERYIGECLDSVLNQSLKDIEVICIDDASTDHSPDILNQYAERDSRVRVIAQAQSIGPSTARNIGYREAKGEYVYQIDGDDWIVDGALERMYTCAAENQLDFLTFSASAFADTEEIRRKVYNSLNLYIRIGTYQGVMKGMELFAECIRNGDFLGNLCCIFLNKDFFDSDNMYLADGLYASADNNFQFYVNAQRVMCIPDALYMRRFRENSIVTSPKTLIKFESMLTQYIHEILIWHKYSFEDAIERALETYFAVNWKGILKAYDAVGDKDVPLKLLPKHKLAKFVYEHCFKKSGAYWTKLTDEVIHTIHSYKNVIIYGAKDIAQEVKALLERNEIYNYIFAVSDNKNETDIAGRKIYNIDELKDKREDSIVLIAVSKRNQAAVKEKLGTLGFKTALVVE